MEERSKYVKKNGGFGFRIKYLVTSGLTHMDSAGRSRGVSLRWFRLWHREERRNIHLLRVGHGRRPMRWSRLPFAASWAYWNDPEFETDGAASFFGWW